jgi:hypothetical protein
MNRIFYIAIVLLSLFELANVYLIMPMPGSQEINSINLAYFLHHWRWLIRIICYVLIILSFPTAFKLSKWFSIIALLIALSATYVFNFQMKADHMFYQPANLVFKKATENVIDPQRLILGISVNGIAKAYPIYLIGYHHQVRDTIADKNILVSYCTVCRSGRVFDPIIDGMNEEFRLVGMDHYNAMFEDERTMSWWRQENGEAVAGPRKGMFLNEIPSHQTTLNLWLQLNPDSWILQPDPAFINSYDTLAKFEQGKSKSRLTRRDSSSWQNKSWIIGIQMDTNSIAIDWNELLKKRVINFGLGYKPCAVVLASDNTSFFAYECPFSEPKLIISRDTLYTINGVFNLAGKNISGRDTIADLPLLNAYQEYWQSWKTFHPHTLRK